MKNDKLLNVHIGVHKNATTHLQQVLQTNRSVIENGDRAMFLPRDLRPALGEHLFGLATNDNADHHRRGLETLFGLSSQQDDTSFRLIFDENICGRIKPIKEKVYPMLASRLDALLSVFSSHQVSVFVCLRNYADFYRSSYLEYIRTSRHVTFEEFIGGLDYRAYGWQGLIDDLLTLVTPQQLVLYRYDQYREVLPKLVDVLTGVSSKGMDLHVNEQVYQSLSNKAIDIVENSSHILTRDERVKALAALQDVFPKQRTEDPRSYWTAEEEQQLKTKFEDDYQELRHNLEGARFIDQ